MHRWRPAQKRLMLAAMLAPWALVVIGAAVTGSAFASGGGSDTFQTVVMVCFAGGFLIAFITAMCCLADAAIDRRVRSPAPGWAVSLLLAPTMAGPAYWWLHVRPGPGEPHGLKTLTTARAWPAWLKRATGVAAVVSILLFVAWMAWIVSFFFEGVDEAMVVLMFAVFGLWTLVACGVVGLFVLDALREGGPHAMLWTTLLVLAWVVAAPLYWFLHVRPAVDSAG